MWSESPCIDSDVDESDFLGFRMNGERKKEEQAMRKDKPARKRKRRRKYKVCIRTSLFLNIHYCALALSVPM